MQSTLTIDLPDRQKRVREALDAMDACSAVERCRQSLNHQRSIALASRRPERVLKPLINECDALDRAVVIMARPCSEAVSRAVRWGVLLHLVSRS